MVQIDLWISCNLPSKLAKGTRFPLQDSLDHVGFVQYFSLLRDIENHSNLRDPLKITHNIKLEKDVRNDSGHPIGENIHVSSIFFNDRAISDNVTVVLLFVHPDQNTIENEAMIQGKFISFLLFIVRCLIE